MAHYSRIRIPKEPEEILKKPPQIGQTRDTSRQPDSSSGLERSPSSAGSLSQSNVLQLQRTVGNKAVEQLLAGRTERKRKQTSPGLIQRSIEEEEELLCPGSKIRSEGQGQGKGYGQGKGPLGNRKDEEWG